MTHGHRWRHGPGLKGSVPRDNGSGPDGSMPPRHRLWRDRRNGMIFGVIAGFADYFGIGIWKARALALLGFIFFPPQMFLVYVAAAILMKPKPDHLPLPPPEEVGFLRRVHRDPRESFAELRWRFRDIDRKLADIESTVTSPEFKLRRDFDDLERNPPRPAS